MIPLQVAFKPRTRAIARVILLRQYLSSRFSIGLLPVRFQWSHQDLLCQSWDAFTTPLDGTWQAINEALDDLSFLRKFSDHASPGHTIDALVT